MKRCSWLNLKNPDYVKYHDEEWSIPVTKDTKLFEFIVLESAQAGLSWETILNRREGYRKAFKRFNPRKISLFTQKDIQKLMHDEHIIRNKLKIQSAIHNAKVFLQIQKEFKTFFKYLQNYRRSSPAELHRDLKRRGFKFFGPTICYSYMQAVGLRNDHEKDCFLYKRKTTS